MSKNWNMISAATCPDMVTKYDLTWDSPENEWMDLWRLKKKENKKDMSK